MTNLPGVLAALALTGVAACGIGPVSADSPSDTILIVRMLDLGGAYEYGGGGEAILLTDSSASGLSHALIDAGPGTRDGSVAPGFVADRLRDLGVDTLAYLQLSHAHADHYSGIEEVVGQLQVVERFVYNGQPRSLEAYQRHIGAARAAADTTVVLSARAGGHTMTLGAATRIETLPPHPEYTDRDTNESRMLNEASLGTAVSVGESRLFFSGDAQQEAIHRFQREFPGQTRQLMLLKVGHHGANNAIFDSGTRGSSSWLDHTAPEIAIISSNGRTHPRVRALARLHAQPGIAVYCTHVHGEITLRISGDGTRDLRVSRNEDQDCVPGTEADS